MLKGLFKDSHPVLQILMVVVIFMIGSMGGSVISMAIIFFKVGFSYGSLMSVVENLIDYPAFMREYQFFSALGGFILASICLAWLFSEDYKEYLQINTPISLPISLLVVLGAITVIPFLNFVTSCNQQIHFPEAFGVVEEYLRQQEELMARASEAMINPENSWAFILNIVVIGIFAAVGEEFLFRGVLQNILGGFIRNHHVVIWVTAFIFSAFHLQFFGLITRMLLGAIMGYLLYFTKNMWMPVLAHFTNNLLIIVIYPLLKEDPERLELFDSIGTGETWWLAVASAALFLFIISLIRKKSGSLQHLLS